MPELEPTLRLCDSAKRKHDDRGPSEAQPHSTKRQSTCPSDTLHAGRHRRRGSEGEPLNLSDETPLSVSPVETLPQEVLLQVFEHLVDQFLITARSPGKRVQHYSDDFELDDPDRRPICRKDLRNVCLVCPKFKLAATTLLYRYAHLATAKSPDNLVFSLQAHQELQPLVKHISVPTYQGVLTDRFDFTFLHDAANYKYWDLDDGSLLSPPLEEEFFAECGRPVDGNLLRRLVSLVPCLRTLVIPQFNLYAGPYSKDMVLSNLTTLRITLMAPVESTFYMEPTYYSTSTLRWLDPRMMHDRFPSLLRLEVYTPDKRWEADLVTEKPGEGPPLKFVESLTTRTKRHEAPAEWDLMSLSWPIFNSSKLHTLKFAGPGLFCNWVTSFPYHMKWDLNRFLTEKGGCLHTLSLDWECHNTDEDVHSHRTPQAVYFGEMARITALDGLSSLTHLTISLQALFGYADTFYQWVDGMEADIDSQLTKLLPPSLRTLRIAEYLPDVFEAGWTLSATGNDDDDDADADFDDIRSHVDYVYSFLQALRANWLLRAEGRELWFRRYALLDHLRVTKTGTHIYRLKLKSILDGESNETGGYQRVIRPAEDMVWDPYVDTDSDSVLEFSEPTGQLDEETNEVSDEDKTDLRNEEKADTKDEDQHGEPDGEPAGESI